jgi:hypothetical protein
MSSEYPGASTPSDHDWHRSRRLWWLKYERIPVFRPTQASNVEIDARPFCFGQLIEMNAPLDTRSARSFLDVFERAIEQAANAVVVYLCRSVAATHSDRPR